MKFFKDKYKVITKRLVERNKDTVNAIVQDSLIHYNGISGVFYPQKRENNGYIELIHEDKTLADDGLPLPPPSQLYRESYGKKGGVYHDDIYLKGGKTDTNIIRFHLKNDNFEFGLDKHILELGCSGARMLRWFQKEASFCECWGCDVNTGAIAWCQQNLSPPFHFFPNTTSPHLPFSDGYFSLIYAGSVFTHIGELADTWLLELRRVLSQDGRIFISVFDDISYEILTTEFANSSASIKKEQFFHQVGLTENNYGKFVFSTTPRLQHVGYNREYLCNKLKMWFDVKGVYNKVYGWQSGLLLAKKSE